jgi:hypothetical protein
MSAPVTLSAALVRGRVARFTKVDSCGMPQTTAASLVTEGVITVGSTKNVDAGDAISQRIMNGQLGVYEPGKPTVTSFSLDINLLRVNPALITMLTGDPVILSADGTQIVGFEELALVPITTQFAMELWTDTAGNFCQTANRVVGYMVYPFIGEAYLTIDNIADGMISAHIMGQSHGSPSWGKGPYLPVAASGGAPARLLAAMDSRAHRHFELTTISPPAITPNFTPATIVLPTPS